MAETEKDQRTENATPKRIEDSRKKGQIARSRELSTCAALLAAAGAMLVLGGQLGDDLLGSMRGGLDLSRVEAMDDRFLIPSLTAQLYHAGMACAPLFGVLLLAVLAAPIAIGGWNLSAEAITPKFERMNPITGIGRMFSMNGLVELVKALAKFGLVAAVAFWFLIGNVDELMALGNQSLSAAIGHATQILARSFFWLAGALALIAALDVPYQLWKHAHDLRMTREEVRQEHKESDGSPEVKGRIRQLQAALSRGRMMQDVPTADVIVTNPTHFAVALRYDDTRMSAPVVVAKGTDLVALRIRELASEHGIPIVEAPPLARALHRSVEIGAAIPSSLYVAVAQILTYVYQLRMARRLGATPPPAPTIQ